MHRERPRGTDRLPGLVIEALGGFHVELDLVVSGEGLVFGFGDQEPSVWLGLGASPFQQRFHLGLIWRGVVFGGLEATCDRDRLRARRPERQRQPEYKQHQRGTQARIMIPVHWLVQAAYSATMLAHL